MKTILTVENIEKYYGNRSNITKAVDNISFSVDEGEFIGVMGPSGSGKTTLLNCISTIDNVTSGHIYINGKEITNPSLILADEPTGALDSKSSRMLLDSMERLNIEYNATIMMVTHDAFTASYAHRILFIKDGKIFNEIVRGESSRKDFFNQIMEVVTLLGGDTSNVL